MKLVREMCATLTREYILFLTSGFDPVKFTRKFFIL